ncbi:MAG TPA: WYL domain-containing protein [Longimicrobiales bacterium]
MTPRISKTQRWLDLIAFLVGRRLPVTVDQIMEGVPAYAEKWKTGDETARDSARRMFERDKDELRKHGIPLQTLTYTVNMQKLEGYRIQRRDFYLPYLRLLGRGEGQASAGARAGGEPAGMDRLDLSEEEARLALDALRRVANLPSFPLAPEARSAFRKLAFDLDPDAFADTPVLFVERPGARELTERVRLLSDALLSRKRVRFRYRGIYRDEETQRDVAPYGLLFQHSHWYLVGHDALRDAVRVFRVGRMEDVEVNQQSPNTPDYEIPESFRLEDYAGRNAWELGAEGEQPVWADVLFRFPASLLAERNRHGELVESRPDGSAVRRFRVVQVNPFVRWLLGMEGEAEVLAPAELAAELRRMAAEIAAAHRTGAGKAGERDDG